MNSSSVLTFCAVCLFAAGAVPTLAHAEPGNKIKMTVSVAMQMPGMNVPARSHTMETCASKKKPDARQMIQKAKGCTIGDYKEVGDTVSFNMECTEPMAMKGETTVTFAADGGMRGQTHMTSSIQGKAMVIDTTYTGQRIGDCDYKPRAEK